MTPLARWLARYLPSALRVPALAVIYATALLALVLASDADLAGIAYIDVGRGR